MDKVTLIRSVSHPYPIHGVAYATTGNPVIPLAAELNPRDPLHWPFIGSVVDHVDGTRQGRDCRRRPRSRATCCCPGRSAASASARCPAPGPTAGSSARRTTRSAPSSSARERGRRRKTLLQMTWNDLEPYRGITPESRFQLGSVSQLGPELTLDRLDRRRSLLEQIEHRSGEAPTRRPRRASIATAAWPISCSPRQRLRQAFDLGLEPAETRDLYGMTLFGQAALTARRLVEAGGRFVTVFWDEYGLAGTGWDTHWDHFPRMKDELLPGLDRTLSGLLIDLDRRGLLDETLVVLLERARPDAQSSRPCQGGGRDHWSRCYSVVMAGGGIARGRVVGRSDKIASDPLERRVSPKDILATIYHLLGIDPATTAHRPPGPAHADRARGRGAGRCARLNEEPRR